MIRFEKCSMDSKIAVGSGSYVSVVDLIYQRAKLRQELQIIHDVLMCPDPTLHNKHINVTTDDLIASLVPRVSAALEKTYIDGADSKEADADVIRGIFMRAENDRPLF